MEIILIILALVLVSYVVGERAFRIHRISWGSIFSLAHGSEFVALGLLMGPYGLGVLSIDVVDKLEPLINITLGWIGLMFGAQFRIRDVRLLPPSNYFVAGTEAITTFAIVFAAFMAAGLAMPRIVPTGQSSVSMASILAAIAIVSSSSAIAAAVKRTGAHGRVSRLLRYTAGFDNLMGLAAFGLMYPFFHITAQHGTPFIPGWAWLFVSLAAGLVLGALFHYFTTPRATGNENLTMAVGMIVLTSGIAAYLHLSSLFISMIVGIVLCNFSERQDRFYRLLVSAEKPLYGILLITGSALWQASWALVVFVAIFVAARITGKTLGGLVALERYRTIVRYPEWFGPALVAHGSMALAMALDYRFLVPGDATTFFVSVTLTALVLDSLASPLTCRHMLTLEGETP